MINNVESVLHGERERKMVNFKLDSLVKCGKILSREGTKINSGTVRGIIPTTLSIPHQMLYHIAAANIWRGKPCKKKY